ncbi:hypothetical protein [Methylocella sp.]|uniref:hypothetical protein n=1 Tax=Methylocella sp. TaxID=1978226 RepID=UPI0035B050AC
MRSEFEQRIVRHVLELILQDGDQQLTVFSKQDGVLCEICDADEALASLLPDPGGSFLVFPRRKDGRYVLYERTAPTPEYTIEWGKGREVCTADSPEGMKLIAQAVELARQEEAA